MQVSYHVRLIVAVYSVHVLLPCTVYVEIFLDKNFIKPFVLQKYWNKFSQMR
jgi:hypothetical protein